MVSKTVKIDVATLKSLSASIHHHAGKGCTISPELAEFIASQIDIATGEGSDE